jgi:hypothetical protein
MEVKVSACKKLWNIITDVFSCVGGRLRFGHLVVLEHVHVEAVESRRFCTVSNKKELSQWWFSSVAGRPENEKKTDYP